MNRKLRAALEKRRRGSATLLVDRSPTFTSGTFTGTVSATASTTVSFNPRYYVKKLRIATDANVSGAGVTIKFNGVQLFAAMSASQDITIDVGALYDALNGIAGVDTLFIQVVSGGGGGSVVTYNVWGKQ